MKQRTLNAVVKSIIFLGILLAVAGGWYAYYINQL